MRSEIGMGAVFVVAIAAAMFVIPKITGSRSIESGATELSRADTVRLACREFVKAQLHDPDSAQFDDWRGFEANERSPESWQVVVTGRAKNGFNALRVAKFECRADHYGGQVTVTSIRDLH